MPAHDAPEYAAARAFADLPVLPGDPALPERETFRARLLARDASTMRDRQRAQLERYLSALLPRIIDGDDLRLAVVGAVMAAHRMDIVTAEEAKAWMDRAWKTSRAAE